jgi:hypothetical protein
MDSASAEREREKREGGGGIVLVQCNRASFLLLRVRFSALLASLLAQPHDDDGTITVAELSLLGPEVNRVPVGPAGAGSGFHRWDDVVRMCTGGGAPHAPSCGGDADAPCRCQRAVCHLSSASVGFFFVSPTENSAPFPSKLPELRILRLMFKFEQTQT